MVKVTREIIDAPALAAFWSKIDMSGGKDTCWPWTGTRQPDRMYRSGLSSGYGNFAFRRNRVLYRAIASRIRYTPRQSGRLLSKGETSS